MKDMCFVFGSNEGGIHGAGAAREALFKHGAVMGCGYGHVGNSFAIPTKDRFIQRTLKLDEIEIYVKGFLQYADARPDLKFQVTRIGCGLAGLRDEDTAQMFIAAPMNCYFDEKWEPHFATNLTYNYWGTF